MGKIRIEPNLKAYAQIRQSPEMRTILERTASDAVKRCGQGYQYKIKSYSKVRAGRPYGKFPTTIAVVIARTKKAQQDNLDNNTLIKAVFGR